MTSAVNYMGIMIAFIFVLVGKILVFNAKNDQLCCSYISVIQLMMPSLRQIGDFFGAVYAPYGEDEVADNRYDYSYSDDYKPYMQQFRNVRVTVRRSPLPCSFNTDYFQFNEVPDLSGDSLRSLGAIQPQTSLLSPLLN